MTAIGGVTGVKTTKRQQAQRRPPQRKWITTLLLGDSQFPLPTLHLLRLLQTKLENNGPVQSVNSSPAEGLVWVMSVI